MNYKEISDLIKLVGRTELSELKIKDKDFEIQIRSANYSKGSGSSKSAPATQVISVPAAPQAVAAPAVTPPAPAPAAAPAAPVETAPAASNTVEIKSPIVGTFYRASSPDKPPFKKVGDTVQKGEVVCIVEAMKLFNEIESEVSGTIVKVLVEDASPVEYDQPIFIVEP